MKKKEGEIPSDLRSSSAQITACTPNSIFPDDPVSFRSVFRRFHQVKSTAKRLTVLWLISRRYTDPSFTSLHGVFDGLLYYCRLFIARRLIQRRTFQWKHFYSTYLCSFRDDT